MAFDDLKTIAAFGGLELELVNLPVGLYKDFWRKGKRVIRIEDASAKCVEEGVYDIRIAVIALAKVMDIHLTSMTLRHGKPVFGPYDTRNTIQINRSYRHTATDLLDLTGDAFKAEMERLSQTASVVRDYKIGKDSQVTILIADRCESVRLPDGYEEWPCRGWKDTNCGAWMVCSGRAERPPEPGNHLLLIAYVGLTPIPDCVRDTRHGDEVAQPPDLLDPLLETHGLTIGDALVRRPVDQQEWR
jgi:hypothetical protein